MSEHMHAMQILGPGGALTATRPPRPAPGPGQVLLRVAACGVCRTDLHILDGDLALRHAPLTPGHEVVGRIAGRGAGVEGFPDGMRVGVPWLAYSCGRCDYCLAGRENLCDAAAFTGYDRDGGYAEYCVADARYCFALPERFDDEAAAPLLCAGLIGYRALCMAGDARRLGVMGFGAAAHILTQVARWQGREVHAFTRPGDSAAQGFAKRLGAVWAGGSDERPHEDLDAVVIFAPVGALVPAALRLLRKGGRVVCGGIHMSDIPAFPYDMLWGERQIVSVANLTRKDAVEFLDVAARVPVRTHVRCYPLKGAGEALDDLRAGRLEGAAVLHMQAAR